MAELDVVVNAGRAQAGARAVRSAMDDIRRTAQGVAAGLYTLERGFTAIWSMTDKAASFEESWRRLNIQTAGFHSTAQLVINDLKAVTNGQLSTANATQLASRGLAEGLNPDTLRTFATAADALADVMGQDLNTAYDSILQSVATGRTQILGNIGVFVDLDKEVKQLAVSTNRTTDQISKQEKAMIAANAVTRQLDTALGKMADDAVSEADKLKAIEARFDDMTLAAGRFSKSLVVATADFFKMLESMRHDTSINPFAAANLAVRQSTPGHMESPGFQEILGRSIVSDTQGNLARRAEDEAKRRRAAANAPLDPKLRALQITGDADRVRAQLEQDQASLASGLQHQTRLRGFDQQRGEQGPGAGMGAMNFLKMQHDAQLRELAFAGETQNKLLMLETETYRKRTALGFESTQEKISAEETYKTKVASINGDIAKIVQGFSNAASEAEAERTVLRGTLQEQLGQQITDRLISEFKTGEDFRHREQDEMIRSVEARIALYDAYGTSRENQLTAEYDLVRANLAKQLDVTYETAAKVLNAWRSNDFIHANELLASTGRTWDQNATIVDSALAKQRAKSEKASDDMWSGFADSMHRYVNDQSMFGLGADQARSVATAMQQSFKTFFFDVMNGEVKGLKDVMEGLISFTQNMVADVGSKLMSRSLLSGLDALPGLFSGGGGIPSGGFNAASLLGMPGFARGGITSGPSLAGEAGPEAVVPLDGSRSIPVKIMGGSYGMPMATAAAPVNIQIVNQNSGRTDVQTESRQGSDGSQQITIIVKDIVHQAFSRGEFDAVMRTNYNATRRPTRR